MTTYLKRGQSGPLVKTLQLQILQLNPLALPRYGVDGRLGGECFHALAVIFKDESIIDDQEVTIEQMQVLAQLITAAKASAAPVFIDARSQSSKAEKRGLRDTKLLDIIWHQTDCEMGERPERYYGVPVHFVVTSGGKIIQLHSIEYLIYHAHALNQKGIGVELEGHFEGIEGDSTTYPKYHWEAGRSPQRLTPIQTEAAKECGRIIKGQVESYGGTLRYQLTHRQGSDTRRRDPGSQACKEILLPLSAELGVPFNWSLVAGKGQQAPMQWHPDSTAAY